MPHELIINGDGVGLGTIKLDAAGINTSSIGFTTYHRFRQGERVVYDPLGSIPIVGLATQSTYYVSSVSEYTVQLHKSYDEAIAGVNTISFTDFGSGVQSFKSLNGKAVLSSVVLDSGSGYENKQRSCEIYWNNYIFKRNQNIKDHDYKTGEIVQYSVDGTAIDGLSTDKQYYVSVINKDQFKLAAVGVGTTVSSFYINNRSV